MDESLESGVAVLRWVSAGDASSNDNVELFSPSFSEDFSLLSFDNSVVKFDEDRLHSFFCS